MTSNDKDEMDVVPATDETQSEHDRIRASNDKDQKAEREGKVAPHNRGYDEVADLKS